MIDNLKCSSIFLNHCCLRVRKYTTTLSLIGNLFFVKKLQGVAEPLLKIPKRARALKSEADPFPTKERSFSFKQSLHSPEIRLD